MQVGYFGFGVPGHVVSFHDPGSDTITKLPDPEWDRIDALERHIERLDRRIRTLQDKLEGLGASVGEHPRDESEPAHVHRTRANGTDEDDVLPNGEAPLPSREAVSG